MLKSYRSILCAIAGLVLAGATNVPQPSEQPKQAAPTEIGASAKRETIIPRNEDRACEERQDRRQSDLCAQWKAADAARDAANYAVFGIVLSFLGTILLFVTFLETRRISRREQRAYVCLSVPIAPFVDTLHDGQFRIRAKNYGATPALKGKSEGGVFMATIPLTEETLPDIWQFCGEGVVLHPDEPSDFGVSVYLSRAEIDQAAIKSSPKQLYVVARYSYIDVFGAPHVEQVCRAVRYGDTDVRIETTPFGNRST